MIRLTIQVWPSEATAGGGGRLFIREVNWPFMPRDDGLTEIAVLKQTDPEYGDEWYAHTRIYRSFFHADGDVHIELVGWQIDPIPLMEDYCLNPRSNRRPWRTDIDGSDLAEKLIASGWREYDTDPVKDYLNRVRDAHLAVAALGEHPGVGVSGDTTAAISDLFHDGFTPLLDALQAWRPQVLS